VYDDFKNDFFPGEEVDAMLEDGEKFSGIIREKAKFPELRLPDGSVARPAFSRYFIRLKDRPGDEVLSDDSHIKRGRHVFTKQNLRSFLKNSLQREAWTGAPWLVKEHLAIQYRLSMEIPPHLQQGARLPEHRQSLPQQARVPGSFNSVRGRKGKNLTAEDFSANGIATNGLHGAAAEQPAEPVKNGVVPEPPKPPPKYPIEDLELPPKHDANSRPRLKFLAPVDGSPSPDTGLRMSSVGDLLELWNTINVLCEVYVVDSFTFDDFLDAMKFSSAEVTCELFEEVHCAVLKQLVDSDGKVQISLPKMPEDDEEDEDGAEDESAESEPVTPVDAPAHATRSRLSHVQNASDEDGSNAKDGQQLHRAAELVGADDWIERLGRRDFSNGGWQTIMVGLLYQLSLDVRHSKVCESILADLAPLDLEATADTARQRYAFLDINLRISALQIITMLSLPTKAMRNYLEEISEDMTNIRKRKVEHQKKRKELYANRLLIWGLVKLTSEQACSALAIGARTSAM